MREISATEAARRFSALLDAVEHRGEAFVVTRGGRSIARIEPAIGASGAAVRDLLGRRPATARWRDDERALPEVGPGQGRAWPD